MLTAPRELRFPDELSRLRYKILKLRAALTKLETEIRNRGDAERLYIELIEAALNEETK